MSMCWIVEGSSFEISLCGIMSGQTWAKWPRTFVLVGTLKDGVVFYSIRELKWSARALGQRRTRRGGALFVCDFKGEVL